MRRRGLREGKLSGDHHESTEFVFSAAGSSGNPIRRKCYSVAKNNLFRESTYLNRLIFSYVFDLVFLRKSVIGSLCLDVTTDQGKRIRAVILCYVNGNNVFYHNQDKSAN